MPTKITEDDLDSLEFDVEDLPESNHYVDKKEVYDAIVEWKGRIEVCESKGQPSPQIPNIVARAILDTARNLTYHRRFINYSYKDEMIGEGIETCVRYIHNYDLSKKNPFAYITKITWQAFFRRINKERREHYYKLKTVQLNEGFAADALKEMSSNDEYTEIDSGNSDMYNDILSQVSDYEKQHREQYKKLKEKTERKLKSSNLEEYLNEEE